MWLPNQANWAYRSAWANARYLGRYRYPEVVTRLHDCFPLELDENRKSEGVASSRGPGWGASSFWVVRTLSCLPVSASVSFPTLSVRHKSLRHIVASPGHKHTSRIRAVREQPTLCCTDALLSRHVTFLFVPGWCLMAWCPMACRSRRGTSPPRFIIPEGNPGCGCPRKQGDV